MRVYPQGKLDVARVFIPGLLYPLTVLVALTILGGHKTRVPHAQWTLQLATGAVFTVVLGSAFLISKLKSGAWPACCFRWLWAPFGCRVVGGPPLGSGLCPGRGPCTELPG